MCKVSIIVPVYNSREYLESCLDSLVNQTLKDIEIILINDGSTDDSLEIIQSYALRYPNLIKYQTVKNNGQGSARNYGISLAQGKYLGFIDSDDYIDKKMFEILYNYAEAGNYDLVVCPYYRVDEQGNILNIEMNHISPNRININTGPVNKLFKRALWNEYGVSFSENLWYEDLEAILEYIFISKKIGYINDYIPYYYIQHENSSINQYSSRVNDIFQVLENIYAFLEKNNLLESYRDEIEYCYIMQLVFGHLSRCATEVSFIKRHQYIQETKRYLIEKFPNYYQNKYFKVANLKNNALFLKLIKFFGIRFFKYNIFDVFLVLYRIQLKLNISIKRW